MIDDKLGPVFGRWTPLFAGVRFGSMGGSPGNGGKQNDRLGPIGLAAGGIGAPNDRKGNSRQLDIGPPIDYRRLDYGV